MKSLQEIFNIAASGMLVQGLPSHKPGDALLCAYRGDGGMKCAIGFVLRDDVYDPQFEGCSVSSSPQGKKLHDALLASGIDIDNPEVRALCSRLQATHDSSSPCFWTEKLTSVAQAFGLDDSVVREFTAMQPSTISEQQRLLPQLAT